MADETLQDGIFLEGRPMADESSDDRWTVRGVPKAYRERAVASAQRHKISLGLHVCAALDLADQAERNLEQNSVLLQADKMSAAHANGHDLAAFADRVVVLERLIEAAAKLTAEPAIPELFRKRAQRVLNKAMLIASKQALPPAAPALTFERKEP